MDTREIKELGTDSWFPNIRHMHNIWFTLVVDAKLFITIPIHFICVDFSYIENLFMNTG